MNSTTADECINVNDSYQAHIFRNLHEAIVVLDRAYAIAYWNGMAEEILGWSSGEAAGKNVRELLKPAFFRSSWDTEIARMLREKSYEGMVELQKKTGARYTRSYMRMCSGIRKDGYVKSSCRFGIPPGANRPILNSWTYLKP